MTARAFDTQSKSVASLTQWSVRKQYPSFMNARSRVAIFPVKMRAAAVASASLGSVEISNPPDFRIGGSDNDSTFRSRSVDTKPEKRAVVVGALSILMYLHNFPSINFQNASDTSFGPIP